MTRTDAKNALGVVAVLVAGALATTLGARATNEATTVRSGTTEASVRDATGARVPIRPYHRIVSGSLVADRLLLELAEPERVLAYSTYVESSSAVAHRHAGTPSVDLSGDLEALLSMRPDLVFASNFVDPAKVARLRQAGIAVFDLGPMYGVATLLPNIRQMGAVLGCPERGEALARAFETRLASVADDVPPARRPSGIYLGIHASQVYGGTRGSSFHDVIEAAGLVDVAATRYRGWPSLTSEQVLALDPDYVITQQGKATLLCRHAGLSVLRACRTPGRLVEVDDRILNDPGLAMLDAAEAIRLAVHGPPGGRGP
ncbi:MAG: ABC transporter substrate-binding protein [Polyangiales bacterium]